MKKILFVIDKLELKYFEFNNLVTNFWLIREFLKRDISVSVTTISNLFLRGASAFADCYNTFLLNENIFYDKQCKEFLIDDFDLVLFRPDPPVDINYINATYVFDFVKKARVINSPRTIRNFNEKLHSVYFNDLMAPNIVTASLSKIEEFLKEYKQIVLKPLNQCFGAGVMYLYYGDPNTRTIINTMTKNESTLIMVQQFIPKVKDGDIRILTLGDKVLKYAVKKLPSEDDFKFNTHNDEHVVDPNLSENDLFLYSGVAKKLNSMGLPLVGLDVIDGKIIEVNVTSPCYFIKEINSIYNVHLEEDICNFILTQNLLSL